MLKLQTKARLRLGVGLYVAADEVLSSVSLVAAFCRDWLRNLAYEEWLQIGLIASPLKAGNGVPRLTRNEVSLSGIAKEFIDFLLDHDVSW